MDSSNTSKKVGLFVFVGLVVIAGLVINFSKGVSWFTPGYVVIVKTKNIGGLKTGAPVAISGVPIGSVEKVYLTPDGHAVLIDCRIEKQFDLHTDTEVEIEQSGFLGDQYVSFVPKEDKGSPVPDHYVFNAKEPFNLQEAARSAMGLMTKLETAVDKINGAVARVDRTLLAEGTLNDVTNTINNLRRVSERAERAIGNIESGVTNATAPALQAITNLASFSRNLDILATNAQAVLQVNQANIQASLANLKSTSDSARQITAELQDGKGLLGAVLKDDHLRLEVDDMVKNFGILSSNLSRHGILWKPKDTTRYTNAPRESPRGTFKQ